VAETDRLSALVEQLLALARLEGGSAPRERIDAAAVVTSRCEMWSPLAEEMGISLVVDAAGGGACLVIPGGLEQVVDNYLDNAVSVSPKGSTIDVSVRRDGSWVEVSVSDSGPGLTEEQRERAFERFWRGPASTGESGSGLGLAVVRQIVTTSGGHARLESSAAGGVRAVARFVAV
jgi:signal transduction histidine kinase